ncbi:SSD domain-containing protein [Aphelenchoides besseyi]|nr:SSD domain-containing protein [Aphelenchoides besseyi]
MTLAFDQKFISLFFHWGFVVHRFRCLFLWLPILLTVILAFGFLWLKEQTTIDPQFVFSPEDASWRYERAVLSGHWPLNEQKFWPGKSYDYFGYVDVIAAGHSDSEYGRPNMLLNRYINELDRINQYIIHNLTVPFQHQGKTYNVSFMDLCMSYDWRCYENDHIFMLKPKSNWGHFHKDVAELANDIIEQEVKITYPIGWRGSEPIYFGAFVGAPHLVDEEGHFDYVRAVRLTYNLRAGDVDSVSYRWRKSLAQFLSNKENPPSQLLEFGLFHNESLPEGLQDVADTLTPKFAIMSFILFSFCLGCSIVLLEHEGFVSVDWVRSKPILGLAGLLCPLFAIVSAFGLLLWLGVLYNAIVNVSPFIIVCIGIDDAFLMTAAWHRTNPEQSAAKRLAETLSEAAVAISITSITDMLTFGIGCMTTLPGVRLFCMYTFWGITFTYIYQITYFTALMAYAGEMEDKGKHALFGVSALEPGQISNKLKRFLMAGSRSRHSERVETACELKKVAIEKKMKSENEESKSAERKNSFLKSFGTRMDETDYVSCGHSSRTRNVCQSAFPRRLCTVSIDNEDEDRSILFCYLMYISIGLWGLSGIQEGLNPRNLVRSSFYLSDFYTLIDETFWQEGLQMQVVVNNPPDLFEKSGRDAFRRLMSAFEGTEYTMEHNATMIWWDAFESKLDEDESFFNETRPQSSQEYYKRCREWLLTAGGRKLWELDMDWGQNESNPQSYYHLKAFRFQVGLRNYRTPTQHTEGCRLMRQISQQFKQFNVTTFHEYYPFADQYIELKPALYRNCVLAVFCMMFVAFIMIPNLIAGLAIVAAIISIDLGVLGYMALWNVNLESVSMITIIMSIGFSVDLSAHIAYAYVKSTGDKTTRAITALETLGWPVFLGAFSTVIGIMILTLIDAYIIQIFFKTVFLVISFSLLHGIVFLPILLTVVIPQTKSSVEPAVERKVSFKN